MSVKKCGAGPRLDVVIQSCEEEAGVRKEALKAEQRT